uniref:Cadherin N-terminal domain-containing protein n=1 Tax=Balaenoptera musculus TaxID=9771 RepID=A0A8C0CCX7_BALMU
MAALLKLPNRGRLALLCLLLATLWEAGAGQMRYSVPEEIEKGSFVGNIAKDLGLEPRELAERGVRIVSRGQRAGTLRGGAAHGRGAHSAGPAGQRRAQAEPGGGGPGHGQPPLSGHGHTHRGSGGQHPEALADLGSIRTSANPTTQVSHSIWWWRWPRCPASSSPLSLCFWRSDCGAGISRVCSRLQEAG